MTKERKYWHNVSGERSDPKDYQCAFCSNQVGSDRYFLSTEKTLMQGHSGKTYIYICPRCDAPTYFDLNGKQYPAPVFGENISGIDSNIKSLYDEARNSMSVNAFTASAMCCRRLLMNIAVSEGADEGEDFVYYVDYLLSENLISVKAKDWVDHIRREGNLANHKIRIFEKGEAETLLKFTEMLLKSNYEYPSMLPKEKK